MKKNVNTVDRFIRICLSVIFGILMFQNFEDLLLEVIVGVLGIYFILSALFEICLVYLVLGISTKPSTGKRIY